MPGHATVELLVVFAGHSNSEHCGQDSSWEHSDRDRMGFVLLHADDEVLQVSNDDSVEPTVGLAVNTNQRVWMMIERVHSENAMVGCKEVDFVCFHSLADPADLNDCHRLIDSNRDEKHMCVVAEEVAAKVE